MRVWLAPSAFFPHRGGVEELTLKLAQHLERQGHEVLIVVHRHPDALASSDVVENVAVRRLRFPSAGRGITQLARFGHDHIQVQRMLRALPSPDLVHIQCPSNQTLPLALFTARHGVPLVLTSQGEVVMDADGIFQRSAYLRQSLRFAARRAARLTACSPWTARQAATIAPEFTNAIPVANGVDPQDWDVGDPEDVPVFCMWGRHVKQKGFDLAIRAFAEVKQQLPEALLLIGGDGPERQQLGALAGPGVHFVGPLSRDGVQDLLRRSRVVVVPSRVEPFGIVALEALAAGRALVYSETAGGLGFAAGSCGHAVDPRDVRAFSAALVAAATQPVDSAGHREHAGQRSWDVITQEYLAVYAAGMSRPC